MNAQRYLALTILVSIFALSVQPAEAQGCTRLRDYCATDNCNFAWNIVKELCDRPFPLSGTVDVGAPTPWAFTGTMDTEANLLTLTAVNPNADAHPGCRDGAGFVDWFSYTGDLRVPLNTYEGEYGGTFETSCGRTGEWEGLVLQGLCDTDAGGGHRTSDTLSEADNPAVSLLAITGTHLLRGNYPNPFNPTTSIVYELPEAAHVRLAIYNVMGQRIATLVDGVQESGTYTREWNGRSANGAALPSGTYLYRLEAEGIAETGRMVLLK